MVKGEVISLSKKIIAIDKETKKVFLDEEARAIIGTPDTVETAKKPYILTDNIRENYLIFIQSKSWKRVPIGTRWYIMRIKKRILKEIYMYCSMSLDQLRDICEVSSENKRGLIRNCLSTIDAKIAYDLINKERGDCQELVNELYTPSKELSQAINSDESIRKEMLEFVNSDESKSREMKVFPLNISDNEMFAISKDIHRINRLELQIKKNVPIYTNTITTTI